MKVIERVCSEDFIIIDIQRKSDYPNGIAKAFSTVNRVTYSSEEGVKNIGVAPSIKRALDPWNDIVYDIAKALPVDLEVCSIPVTMNRNSKGLSKYSWFPLIEFYDYSLIKDANKMHRHACRMIYDTFNGLIIKDIRKSTHNRWQKTFPCEDTVKKASIEYAALRLIETIYGNMTPDTMRAINKLCSS